MAAVKAPSSTRPALYKMVSLPSVKMATGVKKSSESQSVASSYNAFLTSINRMGATVNSMIVVNMQILKALTQGLKLKNDELEGERKKFQREKQDKGKVITEKSSAIDWASKFAGFAGNAVGSFFEGLAQLGQFFLRAFLVQGILRWISDPKNGEKLAKIVNGLVKIFQWLYKFITENLFKAIEGLVDMFDSDKSLWDRIKGFGNFLVGFGSLLLGFALLKKPGMVLSAFRWVLQTLFDNLTKSKKQIASQAKGLGSAGGAAASGFGAWSAEQSAKASTAKPKGGGKAGLILGGMALLGTGVAAGMALSGGEKAEAPAPAAPGGSSDASKISGTLPPASGGMQPPQPKAGGGEIPFAAEGGVFTKPTQAIVGERGPELRMPLSVNMPIPSNNDQRRKDAGIKPLSSLGGAFGGGKQKKDDKQATILSKLFIAPFKGIGAGIIANITQTVNSLGAAGSSILPIVGNILAPIANSFGVPITVLKSIQGKQQSIATQTGDEKRRKPSELKKLFGKGRNVSVGKDQKKYNKKGDTSVLGLLTDLLGAALVIENKIGKGSSKTSGPTGPAGTGPAGSKTESLDPNSASAQAAAAAGAGSVDLAAKGATDAMKAGQSSENREQYSSKDKDAKRRHLDVKVDNKEYVALLNTTNGDYEVFEKGFLGIKGKQIDIKADKNNAIQRESLNQVRAYYINNDKARGLSLNYITQQDVDNKIQADKSKKKMFGGLIDMPKFSGGGALNILDEKSGGGWIDGPMSGYPVSLDGGRSIAFEGHGKEWVGFKKAAGGAFVVPFNTPATKSSPNLTNRRLKEAKTGGYQLPSFDLGGFAQKTIYKPKFSLGGTLEKKSSGGFAKAVNWLKSHEGYRDTAYWDVNAYRVGYGSDTQTKPDGKVVGVTKGYKTTKEDAERDLARRTQAFYNGAKSAVGEQAWNKLDDNAHAALTSMAYNYGSVPASVVKAAKTGDKEALAKAIEARQTDDNGVNKKRRISEANLVRGKVQVSSSGVDAPPGQDTGSSDGAKTEEQSKEEQLNSLISKLAEDIVKLNTGQSSPELDKAKIESAGNEAGAKADKLTQAATNKITSAAFASPSSSTGQQLAAATAGVKDQKILASEAAQSKINSAAKAAFATMPAPASSNKVGTAPAPIILPGPSKNIPIEALNPPTSMIQYAWKFNI